MNDDKLTARLQSFETITQMRLEGLMQELTKRVRVVSDDALEHLVQRGVLARVARDGCCKPDGGTCCPNARLRIDQPGLPGMGQ